MFQSIWEDIKMQFRSGNMVIRIVLVNFAIFLSLLFLRLGLSLFVDGSFSGKTYNTYIAPYLELSSDFWTTITHPWVLFTHMFMHYDLFHFGFNMLFMYWFGKIVGDLIGDDKVLPIYLLCGLSSAALFLLASSFGAPFTIGGSAIGASGAVLGIVMAAAAINPDQSFRFVIFGIIPLKYIALGVIIMQLAYLQANNNSGGAFGHIGGLIMGYFIITQRYRGNDLMTPINSFFDWCRGLFSKDRRPKPKVVYRNPDLKKKQTQRKTNSKKDVSSNLSHEQTLDSILDKIKTKGMESLSEEEKEFLLKASKK